MLFVALIEVKGGTSSERIARRAEWQYPEGVTLIAEYWLQTDGYSLVSIVEADNNDDLFSIVVQWGDVLNMKISPAVTAEQGVKLAQQMMSG